MQELLYLTAATLFLVPTGQAGDTPVQIQTQKNGNQVTTILIPIQPPPEIKVLQLPDGKCQGVVLEARNWYCGRDFTDQFNRRWILVGGFPLKEKPAKIAGWEVSVANQPLYFFTPDGNLYRLAFPVVLVPPGGKKLP